MDFSGAGNQSVGAPPVEVGDIPRPQSEAVRFSINTESATFTVENPTDDIDRLLSDELAYEVDGSEFTDAYQQGHWDGFKRLYDRRGHRAPVGLMDRARSVLEAEGRTVEIESASPRSVHAVNYGWHFDHDLWEHQRVAVRAILDAGGGIAALPTAAGKSIVALRAIHHVGLKAVVFVHSRQLLHEWAERVRSVLGVEPGIVGDGEATTGTVTVASLQTVEQRGADVLGSGLGIAVFDECHRTTGADRAHEVGKQITAPWRVGLSATPWRRLPGEKLKIEGATGGVVIEIEPAELIESEHLASPRWRLIEPRDYGEPATATDAEPYAEAYTRCVALDPVRNTAISAATHDLHTSGYAPLITVERLSQGELLAYALDGDRGARDALDAIRDAEDTPADVAAKVEAVERLTPAPGLSAAFLHGDHSTDHRQDSIAAFERGEIDVLISTLLGEGVDIPAITAVVLAQGGKSDIDKIQTVGRALRSAGGDHAVIADVRDRGRFFGDHYEERRETFAEHYGRYGPGWDDGR